MTTEIFAPSPCVKTRVGEFTVLVEASGIFVEHKTHRVLTFTTAKAVEDHKSFKGHVKAWRASREEILALPFAEYAAAVADMAANIAWMKGARCGYLGSGEWSLGQHVRIWRSGGSYRASYKGAKASGGSVRDALVAAVGAERLSLIERRRVIELECAKVEALAKKLGV